MAGAREHVHGGRFPQLVTEGAEAQDVARQRGRVAGDVDDPGGRHRSHGGYGVLAHALAGRIHHDDGGGEAAVFQRERRFSGVRTEKFNVSDPVGRGVGFRVFHRLRYDLGADHAPGLPRRSKGQRPDPPARVRHRRAHGDTASPPAGD